jgi:hypothetical protein
LLRTRQLQMPELELELALVNLLEIPAVPSVSHCDVTQGRLTACCPHRPLEGGSEDHEVVKHTHTHTHTHTRARPTL